MRAFKVGGLWFLRLGRVQLSFCFCRSTAKPRRVAPSLALCGSSDHFVS